LSVAALNKAVHEKFPNAKGLTVKGKKAPQTALLKSGASKVRKIDMPTELIVEQPEDTLCKNYYRTSVSIFPFWGYLLQYTVDGLAQDMVVGNDGSLYFKNPFASYLTDSWVKGVKGEGDTILVQLPQKIHEETIDGVTYPYYAWKMVEKIIEQDGDLYYDYVPDSISQVSKFVYRNDSLIKVEMS